MHSLDDARRYLETGPMATYREHGFGLNRVALKPSDTPIGICGVFKRDTIPGVALGFALLRAYRGRGYAGESVAAVLGRARGEGLQDICALVQPENRASRQVLLTAGFTHSGRFRERPDGELLDRYVIELQRVMV